MFRLVYSHQPSIAAHDDLILLCSYLSVPRLMHILQCSLCVNYPFLFTYGTAAGRHLPLHQFLLQWCPVDSSQPTHPRRRSWYSMRVITCTFRLLGLTREHAGTYRTACSSSATLEWIPWLHQLYNPGAPSTIFYSQTRQIFVVNDHEANPTWYATWRLFGMVQLPKWKRPGCGLVRSHIAAIGCMHYQLPHASYVCPTRLSELVLIK